jgi:cytochrome c-type biogenesis protein CcsB
MNRTDPIRLLILLFLVPLCVCGQSHAQTAPEGNAHPRSSAINEAGRARINPFGEAVLKSEVTTETKAYLAEQVNLEPLRGLGVFHNGRVKVLDTLARETVRKITGRDRYREELLNEGQARTVRYDPLFTLLDLTIDPAYYFDRPLLGVEYLPLREAIIEAAMPGEESAARAYLRHGRITPRMALAHASRIGEKHMHEEAFVRALNALDESLALFVECRANFVLVAPPTRDLPWEHLATLPDSHPARQAALRLGEAWRAGDAAKVNVAAADLAGELSKTFAGVYPGWRRTLEIAYNRANAFEWGFWLYGLALLLLALAFGTGRRWLVSAGLSLLVLAFGLHAAGFIARCILAERFAIQNQFESMTGLSLFGVLGAGVLMVTRRQPLYGAAGAALGFLMLIGATQTGIPGESIGREAPILNTSVLLKYHVTTVLFSYGFITLGMVVSLFYLGLHYATVSRATLEPTSADGVAVALGNDRPPPTRARLLADLDTAQMIVLQMAFWTLGVGILLGAWWADHSWGRWWGWDPKETWALITWIVYLIVIHARIAYPANKALLTAWLSVVGFVVMLWTYFGVNLLLPGLHAYA